MPKSQSSSHGTGEQPVVLTPEFLHTWLLPQPEGEVDKETRGRVLAVGGAVPMPGAIILAGTAVLRAGAGKLQVGTCRSVATAVGVAIPECRVYSLPETRAGGINASAAEELAQYANAARVALIGPGMVDQRAVERLMRRLLPRIEDTVLVLDAMAMEAAVKQPELLRRLEGKVIITPNAGEMAGILGMDKDEVTADPLGTARRTARELGAVVALKGSETYIAAPGGEAYYFHSGNAGMATSGSGDTLAGVVAGLAARGAPPIQALAWGVYLHGTAGDRLARRMGRLGFLIRELLAEIPPIMAEFDGEGSGAQSPG